MNTLVVTLDFSLHPGPNGKLPHRGWGGGGGGGGGGHAGFVVSIQCLSNIISPPRFPRTLLHKGSLWSCVV